MKRKIFVATSIAAVLFSSIVMSACKNEMFEFGGYTYPDYPLASEDDTIDSWTQREEDEIVTVDWFVDSTSYYLPKDNTIVTNEILKKTGVKINFRKATTSDGTELTTMIAGNDLPDILSVTSGMYNLIKDESIYPINGLAERWAPSLNRRLAEDPEMRNTYMQSDGNLYFLMNNFYSTEQLANYAQLDGYMLPNDGIVVRKDYLNAYITYKKADDGSWTDADMANPDGIYDFLMWVKSEYGLSNTNHSVLLSAFDSSEEFASRGLRVLMEYFGCAQEDSQGNYVYPQSSANFEDMMIWLNRLYQSNLLTDGCLGATQSQINTYIQNGEPIMYMGKMITPSGNFRNWELNNPAGEDAAYVPIIFSNNNGQVPQLSFHSSGELATMVTKNCERPDRVIKLLDYLYSEEGQRLIYYGIDTAEDSDNGTFYYTKQPGTTVTLANGKEYTYKYGQIEYTEELQKALKVNVENYGIYFCMFICNPMYMYLTSTTGGQFNNYRDYVKWNSRAALIPYTYNYRGFDFVLDSSDSRYKKGLTAAGNMMAKWYKKYTGIIAAASAEDVKAQIKNVLAWCESSEKLSEYIAYKNDCFRAHKAKLGMAYAYPPNDPTSDYANLKITTIFGNTSYYKSVPQNMKDGL